MSSNDPRDAVARSRERGWTRGCASETRIFTQPRHRDDVIVTVPPFCDREFILLPERAWFTAQRMHNDRRRRLKSSKASLSLSLDRLSSSRLPTRTDHSHNNFRVYHLPPSPHPKSRTATRARATGTNITEPMRRYKLIPAKTRPNTETDRDRKEEEEETGKKSIGEEQTRSNYPHTHTPVAFCCGPRLLSEVA